MWYENLETPEDVSRTLTYIRFASSSEANEKLAMRCILKAQEWKDVELEFKARFEYISNAIFIQKPDLAIGMFPWLLKKCDEDRERHSYFMTLWAYKWILSSVKEFASIPLEKIDQLMEDFERRCRDYGTGEKLIHYYRFNYYSETGRIEMAEKEYELYLTASTADRLDDCAACQPNTIADHLLYEGKFEELLEMVDPILKGDLSCECVPRSTYHMAMLSAMMLGRWEEANQYAVLSSRTLRADNSELYQASSHLFYYGVRELFPKGRSAFERQFAHTLRNAQDLCKYEFFTGAQFFFDKLLNSGRKTVKLKLAENKELYQESGVYQTEEVLQYARKQVEKLSKALDKRNGNDYYSKHTERLMSRYGSVVKPD